MKVVRTYKNNPKTQETIAMALGEFPGHRHRSLVYVVWNPFDTEEDSLEQRMVEVEEFKLVLQRAIILQTNYKMKHFQNRKDFVV